MTEAKTLFVLALLIPLVGCPITPRSEPYLPPLEVESPGAQGRQPTDAELRQLVSVSELVLVGRVLERRNAPEGENYRVEVQEILSQLGEGTVAVGESIRTSTLFFRQGKRMARIGKLKQPNRYLFFLAPMEREGWFLHLDDTSGYLLPDAEETLRALRDVGRKTE